MKADLYLYGHFRETIHLPAGTHLARVLRHQFTHIATYRAQLKLPPAGRLPFFLAPHTKGEPCHESRSLRTRKLLG